jgi:hypothetical protein
VEAEERRAAGYPPGKEAGFEAKIRDVTTDTRIPDLIVIPDRVMNGLVTDSDGQPVTTPTEQMHIYVVGDCGKIYVALEHEQRRVPGAVKHNTLLRALPTFGAGEMKLDGGRVIHVNARSGTYQPPREIEDFVVELLRRAGVYGGGT